MMIMTDDDDNVRKMIMTDDNGRDGDDEFDEYDDDGRDDDG